MAADQEQTAARIAQLDSRPTVQTSRPRPFFSWRQAVLSSDLPSTTRHVLLTLGCHMNDAGESCYPSITTLARETGLSRQSVMEHLSNAAAAGWIDVRQHGFRGQIWRRNEYSISWPPGKAVNYVDREAVNQVDQKAVNQVDLSTSVNSSKRTHHVARCALDDRGKAQSDKKPMRDICCWQGCTQHGAFGHPDGRRYCREHEAELER